MTYPTPEPQSPGFRKAHADGIASSIVAQGLADAAEPAPPLTVTTLDGVPTVIPRPSLGGTGDVGQLVDDDALRLMGEEPLRFPRCEFPKCDGEGQYQIISGSGKPLSINRKGELVFGDPPPLAEAVMSPNDRARAMAGLSGVVGPSGIAAARQAPKSHVDVCQIHRNLPHAPKEPKRRYRSGPYSSYQAAAARAHAVGSRTRYECRMRSEKVGGVDRWYVFGDDGAHGFKGSLVEWDGRS